MIRSQAKPILAAFSILARAASSLVLATAILFFAADEAAARYASVVIDAESGEVLHSSNPDSRNYPASLTKVMTLYLVFDALEKGRLTLDTPLKVSAHAAAQAPSKLGLAAGSTIRVEDAVFALVTKSANDVAVVCAEALGGSEANFGTLMTRKARELGMRQTTYRNASGLPDLGQLSTARDQATLARALIRNHGRHYHYFSTRQFTYNNQTLTTHNRLMLRYEGADGIKTGYIHASGFNLIASAKRDGRRLIGVVFGGNSAASRDNHMASLLDKGFARTPGSGIMTADAEETVAPAPVPALKTAKAAAPVKTAKAVKGSKTPRAVAKDDGITGVGDAEEATWGIQIGAFVKAAPAQAAATTTAKKLAGLLPRGRVSVLPMKANKGTLYRARIMGITEDQARQACKRLAKDKGTCQLVQPSA